ncbi:MAG: M48 family metallopeptidase [Pseudomonadota bacterium]
MTALDRYARLEAPGRYFDGISAQPKNVALSFGERTLVIMSYGNDVNAHWPLASLRGNPSADGATYQIMPHADSDERVVIDDPDMIAAIRAVCPDLTRREVDRKGVRRAVFWGGGAVCAVLLMVFVIVPALATHLAQMIPPAREQQVGNAVAKQVQRMFESDGGARYCESAEGLAALDTMRSRLTEDLDLRYPLRIDVLDHKLVNAFALPGGRIILFRGLLHEADSPEEVAGVLAHEIGHVIHQDPTVGVLRAAGTAGMLGLLLGDVFGGTVVVAASDAVVNASYQREAEQRADEVAYTMLTEAGLPTKPFASFFERLAKEGNERTGILKYLASHPDLAVRAKRAAAADQIGDQSYTPILSDRDWVALREICN